MTKQAKYHLTLKLLSKSNSNTFSAVISEDGWADKETLVSILDKLKRYAEEGEGARQ